MKFLATPNTCTGSKNRTSCFRHSSHVVLWTCLIIAFGLGSHQLVQVQYLLGTHYQRSPLEDSLDIPLPNRHPRHHHHHRSSTSSSYLQPRIQVQPFHGRIQEVLLGSNETFMWKGRQRRLCKRIVREEKILFRLEKDNLRRQLNHQVQPQPQPQNATIDSDIIDMDITHLAAQAATAAASNTLFRFRYEMPCEALHAKGQHGNFVYGLYASHLATMVHGITPASIQFTNSTTTSNTNNNNNNINNNETIISNRATVSYDKEFSFSCFENLAPHIVFWWLQALPEDHRLFQTILRRSLPIYSKNRNDPLTRSESCSGMGKIPLQWTSELARYQLRHMALALTFPDSYRSVPSTTNATSIVTTTTFATTTATISSGPTHFRDGRIQDFLHTFPPPQQVTTYLESGARDEPNPKTLNNNNNNNNTMELDQVAIHFRCGDILSGLSREQNDNYGMTPFWVYAKAILDHLEDSELNSLSKIGIVTAPFQSEHLRPQDAKFAGPCRQITLAFQKYLSVVFPYAQVFLRNDPLETIPMVYARLILAELSICIRSTFCLFPSISSFGQAVLMPGGVAYFAPALASAYDNVHLLGQDQANNAYSYNQTTTIPYMLSHEIRELGLKRTLNWLLQTPESIRSQFVEST